MTIICAIDDPKADCVWLGCNDRTMFGTLIGPSHSDKWTVFGDWAIGLTGSGPKLDAIEVVRDKFPGRAKHAAEIAQFMREAYKEYDAGEKNSGVKKFSTSGILVNKSGAVWDFDSSLCVNTIDSGCFWARGSGLKVAVGAASALGDADKRNLIARVLEITIANETDCPGAPLVKKFTRAGKMEAA